MDDDNIPQLSDLEIDLLMVYYIFADQYGKVDVKGASKYARERMGVIISDQDFMIEPEHVEVLTALQVLPDITPIMQQIMRK
jgi:hypothetical protein